MDIPFIKMEAYGHDTIIVDNRKNPGDLQDSVIKPLSDEMCVRRHGVGASSFVYFSCTGPDNVEVTVHTGGYPSEMVTGSVVFCLSRYLFDNGISSGDSIALRCNSIPYKVDILDSNSFRFPVGRPFLFDDRPCSSVLAEDINERVRIGNRTVMITPVRLYSRFRCLFERKTESLKNGVRASGSHEKESYLFISVYDSDELHFAASIGSVFDPVEAGAAALVSGVLNRLCDKEALVHFRKNRLFVDWDLQNDLVYSTGNARYVFSGVYPFETG